MRERVFPEAVPDISSVAGALAEPSRAAMCAALMDGRAWTLGELGTYAGLARSTASEHVDVLVANDIANEVRQGRHRYIRLASEDIARVIESLGVVARSNLTTPHSLRASSANKRLREARTCYQHLAGHLGVTLTDRFQQRGLVDDHWQATDNGHRIFSTWGVPATMIDSATACMDSTERRFHLAGPLGTGICKTLLTKGWLIRIESTRAVRLTLAGQAALANSGVQPIGADPGTPALARASAQ